MKFLFIFYRVKVYDSTLARNTVVGKNQVVVFFVVDALEHKGAEEKCVSALKLCRIVFLGKDSKRNQGGGGGGGLCRLWRIFRDFSFRLLFYIFFR